MNTLGYRGKNRHREFLSAATIISGKISMIDGVVGILVTGGIARGYCDEYSDLDLIVYVNDDMKKEIGKYIAVGYMRCKEIALDTPVESYQKALRAKSPSSYWSQVMRWDRQNSRILCDTDGRIKSLLKEKLVFPDWEQKKLMKNYRQGIEDHLLGYFEMWEKRGNVINLVDTLLRGTGYLILWIYAKNKKFQPYVPKWLFYYLENNLIPESKYFGIIEKPYLEPTKTINQARKMRDELLTVCDRIGVKFDYERVEDIFVKERANWEKASEKTRHYLGW